MCVQPPASPHYDTFNYSKVTDMTLGENGR